MRILSKTEANAGINSGTYFDYENLYRIIPLSNYNGDNESFIYDATDNLTFYDVEKGAYCKQATYFPKTMNQVSQFTYDAYGNVINDGENNNTLTLNPYLSIKLVAVRVYRNSIRTRQ